MKGGENYMSKKCLQAIVQRLLHKIQVDLDEILESCK